MPITVREIAERTGHGASNRFIERLHYWTRERLLVPMGKRNPGTGKRRVYADSAVHDAVILNAMMEAAVPVAAQRLMMGVVRQERDLGRRVKEAESGIYFFLGIATFQGGHSTPYFHEGPDFVVEGGAERTTVFNLSRLFASVLPPQSETGATSG
jgi:hypothetical protein